MAKRYLTPEQRRSALKLAYTDRDWVSKVDKMPPKQIYAIFFSFIVQSPYFFKLIKQKSKNCSIF